ncbi:MAG: hypothetical protein VX051_04025 [Verrucomicrobiota bacterium]|nr:hypothetical protein [Verrucomicrobiota bacterium]
MKNKITCLLAGAALFGATANAEIVLTDDLSAYGYIDMALTDGEGDGNTQTSVAEFELGLSFTPAESKWSAVAELSFDSSDTTTFDLSDPALAAASTEEEAQEAVNGAFGGNNSVEWETVTISYQYSDTLSFTFGNILTYQGFETYDATGLYQYSYAGAGGSSLYSAGYAVGASADGSIGDIDYGIWVGDTDSGTNSFEYYLGYNGVENLSLNFVYADDPGYETTNVWASYDYGDFTFAAESVETEDGTGADVLDVQYIMVYYAMGDAGLTVRFADGEYAGDDYEKFTVSPSYAFSDNVFGLVELSSEELGDVEQDTLAAELIYSF